MMGSTAGATANKICTRPYVDRDDGDVDDDDGRWTVEVQDLVSFERDWGFFRVGIYSLARLLSASMR